MSQRRLPPVTGEVSVAAATAVVNYDLFQNETFRTAGRPRMLNYIGVAGSAAAGDAKVDLLVDQHLVGSFYNLATGFPTRDHLRPVGVVVPAGATVVCKVTDAPATNPINVVVG
jgi:hypothetical protein